jgi:hypothetical protein
MSISGLDILANVASSYETLIKVKTHELSDTEKSIIHTILKFSFSAIFSNSQNIHLMFKCYSLAFYFFSTNKRSECTAKNVLKYISKLANFKIFKINRKMEILLAIESMILLAFMKSVSHLSIIISENDFILKYPEFNDASIYESERKILFEFCNCVRYLQYIIPPHNNKEHICDLAVRLTEGYSVRHVCGSGMTKETSRRQDIFHKETETKKRIRCLMKNL